MAASESHTLSEAAVWQYLQPFARFYGYNVTDSQRLPPKAIEALRSEGCLGCGWTSAQCSTCVVLECKERHCVHLAHLQCVKATLQLPQGHTDAVFRAASSDRARLLDEMHRDKADGQAAFVCHVRLDKMHVLTDLMARSDVYIRDLEARMDPSTKQPYVDIDTCELLSGTWVLPRTRGRVALTCQAVQKDNTVRSWTHAVQYDLSAAMPADTAKWVYRDPASGNVLMLDVDVRSAQILHLKYWIETRRHAPRRASDSAPESKTSVDPLASWVETTESLASVASPAGSMASDAESIESFAASTASGGSIASVVGSSRFSARVASTQADAFAKRAEHLSPIVSSAKPAEHLSPIVSSPHVHSTSFLHQDDHKARTALARKGSLAEVRRLDESARESKQLPLEHAHAAAAAPSLADLDEPDWLAWIRTRAGSHSVQRQFATGDGAFVQDFCCHFRGRFSELLMQQGAAVYAVGMSLVFFFFFGGLCAEMPMRSRFVSLRVRPRATGRHCTRNWPEAVRDPGSPWRLLEYASTGGGCQVVSGRDGAPGAFVAIGVCVYALGDAVFWPFCGM